MRTMHWYYRKDSLQPNKQSNPPSVERSRRIVEVVYRRDGGIITEYTLSDAKSPKTALFRPNLHLHLAFPTLVPTSGLR